MYTGSPSRSVYTSLGSVNRCGRVKQDQNKCQIQYNSVILNNIKQDWSNFVGFCDAGEKTPNSQIQDVYTYTCKYKKNDKTI